MHCRSACPRLAGPGYGPVRRDRRATGLAREHQGLTRSGRTGRTAAAQCARRQFSAVFPAAQPKPSLSVPQDPSNLTAQVADKDGPFAVDAQLTLSRTRILPSKARSCRADRCRRHGALLAVARPGRRSGTAPVQRRRHALISPPSLAPTRATPTAAENTARAGPAHRRDPHQLRIALELPPVTLTLAVQELFETRALVAARLVIDDPAHARSIDERAVDDDTDDLALDDAGQRQFRLGTRAQPRAASDRVRPPAYGARASSTRRRRGSPVVRHAEFGQLSPIASQQGAR